jgi:hypothetical protein
MSMTRARLSARPIPVVALLALLAFDAALAAPINSGTYVRRFALVVSAHDGGKGRDKLRYAKADARSVAGVLLRLGGLQRRDLVDLQDPTREQVLQALLGIRQLVRQASLAAQKSNRLQRIEFLFYYSGHSDERGLLFSGHHLTYKKIRKELKSLTADVRIAVLDSCSSGALTRTKGGRHQPPFLIDRASDVRGHAFLTSASGTEAAQESDRLRGSFFTHYLVSGLRGAADANGDKRVTLSEAYQYAYHETLARTESTQAGPQHASYAMDLVGSGQVVLTDLRASSALLILGKGMAGRIFLRDGKNHLVAELRKQAGSRMRLSLDPGRYELRWQKKDGIYGGRVVVRSGAVARVEQSTMVLLEKRSLEGAKKGGEVLRRLELFSASFWPGLAFGFRGAHVNYLGVHVVGSGDALTGFEMALGGITRHGPVTGAQLSIVYNIARARLTGAQVAVGFNAAAEGDGVQLSSGVNVARHLDGLQIGMVNLLSDRSWAAQIGLLNLASGRLEGAQLSLVNWGSDLAGLQLSMANVTTKRLQGVQLGMVNVAAGKASGVQLGLINYAAEDDGLVPIGLINIVDKGGLFDPTFFGSSGALGNVVVKMGTRRLYSMFGVGFHPDGEEGTFAYLVAGIGTRINIAKRPYIDIEALINWGLKDDVIAPGTSGFKLDHLAQLRIPVGFKLASWASIFFGPTLDYLISDYRRGTGESLRVWQKNDGERHMHLAIGFTGGLQFTPRAW